MNLKILILTQGVLDMDGMKSGLNNAATLCRLQGLTLSFDYQPTTRQFTSVPLNTDVVHGGYCVNSAEILSEAKPGYDLCCLIYDWNAIYPHPTNPCSTQQKGEEPVQIPVNFYSNLTTTPPTTYPEVLTEFFLHELSHCLAYQSGQTDYTHFKYTPQFTTFAQKSNIDFYLYLIQSYASKMPQNAQNAPVNASSPQMPLVPLTRGLDDGIETLGDLAYNSFSCKTLERPWKGNQRDISCIPKGTYTCKWTFSLRLLKYTYELQNVPGRAGIRIHSGNYFNDTDGCILLGTGYSNINGDSETDIINSKVTVDQFNSLMNKKDFTLVIK